MKVTNEQVQNLIELASGTCQTLEHFAAVMGIDYDDLTEEQHEMIDEQITECPQCGWWCETDELMEGKWGEQVCANCHSDNMDEEEEEE